jgi:hypothetical protein
VGDRINVFHDLFVYVKMGIHAVEKAAEAVLSGGYLKHVLDLALWMPPKLLPPAASRLLAGVRHLVEAVDCGRLPEQLAVPCVVAERKTEVMPVPPEEVPEVERLGAERVVYAF